MEFRREISATKTKFVSGVETKVLPFAIYEEDGMRSSYKLLRLKERL